MYSMGSQVHGFPCCDLDAIWHLGSLWVNLPLISTQKPLQAGRNSFRHTATQLCTQDFILLLLSLRQAYTCAACEHACHSAGIGICGAFRQQDMLLVMLLGTAAQSLCDGTSFGHAMVIILA